MNWLTTRPIEVENGKNDFNIFALRQVFFTLYLNLPFHWQPVILILLLWVCHHPRKHRRNKLNEYFFTKRGKLTINTFEFNKRVPADSIVYFFFPF